MPVVLRHERFRFFFYSNEGEPREPHHVHIRADGNEAKVWLVPTVTIAYNDGFDPRTLRVLLRLTEQHRGRFQRAWDAHFS